MSSYTVIKYEEMQNRKKVKKEDFSQHIIDILYLLYTCLSFNLDLCQHMLKKENDPK